jgi:hypothetical protein
MAKGQNKNLYWFLNFKDEPLMSCRLCHYIFWSLLPNYFAVLLVTFWFIGWTINSLLVSCFSSNIIFCLLKACWRVAEKCGNFARPSNMFCMFTESYSGVDELI